MPKSDACNTTSIASTPRAAEGPPVFDVESLVAVYYPYVRRLALSMLDDGSDNGAAEADDAAQETFIAACQAWDTFRGEAQLRTWLTAIAVNVCRGRLRKRKRRQRLHQALTALQRLTSGPLAPEETALQNEADAHLWQAVDKLGEKHRLPIVLRYVHELSVPEIAAVLGISEGTVHSRLHTARQRLQAQLNHRFAPKEACDAPDA